MRSGVALETNLEERVDLFRNSLGFQDLSTEQLEEIAVVAFAKRFGKGEFIFHQSEPCDVLQLVAEGLVKVSICSASGARITYLLAGRGEPLNLVGPFNGSSRFISAEALEEVTVMCVKRSDFLSFVVGHPVVAFNIISILGQAVDSANARIIDMMEKRVEQRLLKVLHTLYGKFGNPLRFTSGELAELAGTTTESILRAMGRLRESSIIRSGRGEIIILDPIRLQSFSGETLWV